MKFALTCLFRIIAILALIATVLFGMFWTDSGRQMLLHCVSLVLRNKGIEFVIEGLDREISSIRRIYFRTSNKSEVTLSDITLDREKFFDRPCIHINKFMMTKDSKDSSSSDNSSSSSNLPDTKKIASIISVLKFLIRELSLANGSLQIGDRIYFLRDLDCKLDQDEDFCSATIIEKFPINITCRWNNNEYFESIFEVPSSINDRLLKIVGEQSLRGSLLIKNLGRKVANYELTIHNNNIKIEANGHYDDFINDVQIDLASIEYKNSIYTCWGNLYLSKRNLLLKSTINFETLTDFMPAVVGQNFKNVYSDVDINCNFSDIREKAKCLINFIFRKSGNNIGNVGCIYENNTTNIKGNIGWINLYGFDFSNFNCKINDQKQADINLIGKDFEIVSEISFNDRILIKNCKLQSPKGFIHSSKPFFIPDNLSNSSNLNSLNSLNNLDCAFDFNFNQLDFWSKLFEISGIGSGSISYKNKILTGKGTFPELSIKNHTFRSLNAAISDGNIVDLDFQEAKIFGLHLKDANLKLTQQNINLFGKVNKDGVFKISGKVDENFKKISFKDGKITFPTHEIKLDLTWDSILNKHQIYCVLSSQKKSGEAKIDFSNKEMLCDFKSFPMKKFMKLFDLKMPDGRLSGNLSLNASNGYFIGEGKLSISNLTAHKQNWNVDLQIMSNGTKVNVGFKNNANLNNNSKNNAGNSLRKNFDFIKLSAFLPISFKNDGSIIKDMNSSLLDLRISSNARLEKALELSYKSDLRGILKGDLHVTGSLANPVTSGKMQLDNAYIAIGSILLKRGSILLIGEGDRIKVSKGEFIDYKNQKATISGDGKLFFNGILPNIDTNLQLRFNNFALFDSDDLKINIDGNGSMSGPINAMTIRGKVTVPKCEMQDFTSAEEKPHFVIDNDPYFNVDKKNQQNNDFFIYDVSMHCKDIKFIGSIFEMHLRGDLSLSTHQQKGALVGELKLFDGKLNLFGKRMKFTSGSVIFLKEFPFNPKANFKCLRNFGDMTVELDIKTDPIKEMSLNLYSTPNYTKDMILSKMLFGKELKYLTISEAAQLAHVVASFNQKGYIFSVLNTFQKIGIVDNISFANPSTDSNSQSNSLYSDSQNANSQNNLSVSAGKYISDNVYISVNKKNEETSFDIDVSVTPTVSIKANTTGEAGISWKLGSFDSLF